MAENDYPAEVIDLPYPDDPELARIKMQPHSVEAEQPWSRTGGGHVSYRFEVDRSRLALRRTVASADGRETPLDGSLATLMHVDT